MALFDRLPEVRTKTTYETRYQQVSEIKTMMYNQTEPEFFTRTRYETRERRIPFTATETYFVQIPEKRSRQIMRTVAEQVPEQRVRTYQVNVPYSVTVRVPRRVCRMVPRTITVPVEPCCCDCCNSFTELNETRNAYVGSIGELVDQAWTWVSQSRLATVGGATVGRR